MESLQGLKTRKAAVKNVGTITKAMEVVSATKMRKSQEVALRTRPYAIEALRLFRKVAELAGETPWTTPRAVKKTLIVVMASDRGLTGAFNAQVLRAAEALINAESVKNPVAILAIGKKVERYVQTRGLELAGSFSGFSDIVAFDEVSHVANSIVEGFATSQWDRVQVVSTHFRTTLRQEVLVRELLPTNIEKLTQTIHEIAPERGRFADTAPEKERNINDVKYILEPSPQVLFETLMPYLLRMQIYHVVLEANASEHSARRVAMKTASDNADELASALTLAYNKARQAAITKEIIEITGTQNALENV
ncbi:MAG: ATP synthase F1 subunit gamma [Patescibacteria group bacterium]|mgnify:CR=1 FL=1